MYQYLPVQNELFSPEIGTYHAFGLRVLRIREGKEEEVMILPDVSTDFSFILRLASLFTEKQLDPIHLVDTLLNLL